ncbi:hypothetical protein Hanom_Chr04g00381841 [Helianthus anomalus]
MKEDLSVGCLFFRFRRWRSEQGDRQEFRGIFFIIFIFILFWKNYKFCPLSLYHISGGVLFKEC